MLLVTQPSPVSFLPEYSMSSRGEDECHSKPNTSVNDQADPPAQDQKLDLSFTKKAKSRRSFKRLQGLFGGLYGNQTKGKAKHGSASAPNTPAEPLQIVDFVETPTSNGVSDGSSGVSVSHLVSPLPSPSLSRRNATAAGQTNIKKALGLKKKARSMRSVTSLWSPSPQGNNRWCSLSGRMVELNDVELQDLCEAERVALQRVALEQLNSLSLGCHIQLPKDGSRRGLLKRGINLRRSFGLGTEKDKKNKDVLPAAVFGQHLSKVLSHDRSILVRRGKASAARVLELSNRYLLLFTNESGLKNNRMKQSTSTSFVAMPSDTGGNLSMSSPSPPPSCSPDDQETENRKVISNGDVFFMLQEACDESNSLYNNYFGQEKARKQNGSSVREKEIQSKNADLAVELESTTLHLNTFQSAMAAIAQAGLAASNLVSIGDVSSSLQIRQRKNSAPDVVRDTTSLYDALTGSPFVSVSKEDDKHSHYSPLPAQVPLILSRSLTFLEEHGLHTTGLFRVPGSQKRIRQMRDEFDCGSDVYFSDDLNPTDVGGLVKGFLRDLPEALLTKELYTPFIATRRLEDSKIRAMALNLLCALLPPANRDTLSGLLHFLQLVSCHAQCDCGTDDASSEDGGNKMDKRNLATVIGPNILHKVKGSKEFQVLSRDQVDDQDEVISVVEEMIERNKELMKVSASLHDKIFKKLLETEPEAVDYLMKQKCLAWDEVRDVGDHSVCEKRSCFRTASDGSSFANDHSAFQLSPSETYLPENSSIVLCNPAARSSCGSLTQCGSEARDLDSLSSGYFSPFESASPPSTLSALDGGSTTHAFMETGQLQWNQSRQLVHSMSSPSLEALRVTSPTPSLTGSDLVSVSNKSSPRRFHGQFASPPELMLNSSLVRTVVTPATPDMPRRSSKSVSSLSSLVRMKDSLDLRNSNEELASRKVSLSSRESESPDLQSGDASLGNEKDISSSDEGTQTESLNSAASQLGAQQLQEQNHSHNEVSFHHYPWQRRNPEWAEEIDLFQQETLV